MVVDEEMEGRKKRVMAEGAPCNGLPLEKHLRRGMLWEQRLVDLQQEGPLL